MDFSLRRGGPAVWLCWVILMVGCGGSGRSASEPAEPGNGATVPDGPRGTASAEAAGGSMPSQEATRYVEKQIEIAELYLRIGDKERARRVLAEALQERNATNLRDVRALLARVGSSTDRGPDSAATSANGSSGSQRVGARTGTPKDGARATHAETAPFSPKPGSPTAENTASESGQVDDEANPDGTTSNSAVAATSSHSSESGRASGSGASVVPPPPRRDSESGVPTGKGPANGLSTESSSGASWDRSATDDEVLVVIEEADQQRDPEGAIRILSAFSATRTFRPGNGAVSTTLPVGISSVSSGRLPRCSTWDLNRETVRVTP